MALSLSSFPLYPLCVSINSPAIHLSLLLFANEIEDQQCRRDNRVLRRRLFTFRKLLTLPQDIRLDVPRALSFKAVYISQPLLTHNNAHFKDSGSVRPNLLYRNGVN